MNKLIVILGPTASGKSSLAIDLGRELDGEIVSADSRQVYRGLDIGSGKVTPAEQALVPHHLLDIVDPMAPFSLAHYQKMALAAIDDIIARDKLPFLVGGTALYIYGVVDNYDLSDIGANLERRKELEKKTVEELQTIIANTPSFTKEGAGGWSSDPAQGKQPPPNSLLNTGGGTLSASDSQNPRRLIRAIEKLEAGADLEARKKPPRYDSLLIGIDVPREELYKKIDQRVDERIQPASSAGMGMIEEVINLRQNGVSDQWLINLGLEYRFITEYLQNKWPSEEAMAARLKTAIHAFARRQLTWWKRDKRIVWIKNKKEAESAVNRFTQKEKAAK